MSDFLFDYSREPHASACLSADGVYRYSLVRDWSRCPATTRRKGARLVCTAIIRRTTTNTAGRTGRGGERKRCRLRTRKTRSASTG